MRHIKSFFLALFALMFTHSVASATLCKTEKIKQRHRNEIKVMESEPYASAEYKGFPQYNSRVLACNRERDSNGKGIEQVFKSPYTYPEDLPAKLITGKIHYHGVFPFRYFYELKRAKGHWTLTSYLQMHYPSLKHAKKLEVSEFLLEDLKITCAKDNIVQRKNKFGYTACRMDRDKKIDGKTIVYHYKEFWRRNIEKFWSKAGFTVKVKFVPEEVSDQKYKDLKKANAIWHVRLNHNKSSRAMYKGSTLLGRPHPLYAGMDRETIIHEYGHTVGYDDEYQENIIGDSTVLGNKIDTRIDLGDDCNAILSKKRGTGDVAKKNDAKSRYIMCQNNSSYSINYDANSDTDDFDYFKDHSKGVYAWIATSRYGTSGYCKEDEDCPDKQFCDKGGIAGVGTNQCKPGHKDHYKVCSRGEQCASGHCKMGTCYTPKSAKMNETCYVNDECSIGKCSSTGGLKGTCVCDDDKQCGTGKYCDKGVDFTKNSCKSLKDDGEACPAVGGAHTCKSGKCSYGRCYTKGSVPMGGDCFVSDACAQGKCSSIPGVKGECVCNDDNQCSKGYWCNKGLDLKMNRCEPKLKKGEVCGKVGDIGVGHRCKSGKCKAGFGVNLKCK